MSGQPRSARARTCTSSVAQSWSRWLCSRPFLLHEARRRDEEEQGVTGWKRNGAEHLPACLPVQQRRTKTAWTLVVGCGMCVRLVGRTPTRRWEREIGWVSLLHRHHSHPTGAQFLHCSHEPPKEKVRRLTREPPASLGSHIAVHSQLHAQRRSTRFHSCTRTLLSHSPPPARPLSLTSPSRRSRRRRARRRPSRLRGRRRRTAGGPHRPSGRPGAQPLRA